MPDPTPGEVTFDDGGGLTLMPTSSLLVMDGYDVLCFEMTGHWQGTAGTLLDRSGTYRLVNDTVQTVLHLIED